jgi:DNA-binding CsgD family transcriptional regulator
MQEINDLLRLGRLSEAERLLPERVRGDAIGSTAIFLHQLRGWVALLRGDHARAQRELDAMRRLSRSADDPQWQEPLATLQAELALAQGRIADARAAVADGVVALSCAQDLLRATRLTWMGARVEADGAARGAALGEPGADVESAGHVEQLVEALEEEPLFGEGPYNLALARGELARLAHAAGEASPDPGPFREAAEGFEGIALPFQAAYARFREAEALVTGGERAAAAAPLRSAAATVSELGAHGLAAEVEALARRARIDLTRDSRTAKPDAPAEDDPVAQLGLTPRELEVLLLVADGRTNREIGAELFMSEKTASVHVSRILGKLGVGGRVEAAAVAHRLGLTRPERNVPAA